LSIKKEARILGLSAPAGKLKRVPLVGIVFRGSLWLDGMLTCQIEPNRPEHLSVLAQAILQSRQYSQIRAVILSREVLTFAIRISVSDLSHIIDLPVISILEKSNHREIAHRNRPPSMKSEAGHVRIRIAGKYVCIDAARVSAPEAQQIFEVACAKGKSTPEALRVAEVLAKNLT
jgi:endonuclease V-like protein UPF0215 family